MSSFSFTADFGTITHDQTAGKFGVSRPAGSAGKSEVLDALNGDDRLPRARRARCSWVPYPAQHVLTEDTAGRARLCADINHELGSIGHD